MKKDLPTKTKTKKFLPVKLKLDLYLKVERLRKRLELRHLTHTIEYAIDLTNETMDILEKEAKDKPKVKQKH